MAAIKWKEEEFDELEAYEDYDEFRVTDENEEHFEVNEDVWMHMCECGKTEFIFGEPTEVKLGRCCIVKDQNDIPKEGVLMTYYKMEEDV